ncbi:MAG: DegT/DnrJ/EryC1/StrS family aminotransferase [Myxococcota bacterium]
MPALKVRSNDPSSRKAVQSVAQPIRRLHTGCRESHRARVSSVGISAAPQGRMHSRLQLDVSWSDLFSVWRGLPPSAHQQEKLIRRVWGGQRSISVGLSVRSLFDAYVTAMRWTPGTKIAFSGITISHMVSVAEAHGLEVIALDVDPDTLLPSVGDVEAACRDGAAAVLVTRLFGAISSLGPIGRVVHRHGGVLIEDAAQAFAGDFHRGDSAADVSLFSFGLIKRATALGGGIAVLRDPKLAQAVDRVMSGWPRLSPIWFWKRWLRGVLLRVATVPAIYTLLFTSLRAVQIDPDALLTSAARGFSNRSLLTQIRHRPPARLLRLLRRRLSQPHLWRERQATQRHLWMTSIGVHQAVGSQVERHCAWLVVVRDRNPERLRRRLLFSGFDATRAPSRLGAIDPSSSCARWMGELVYVPHPVHMSDREERRLSTLLLGER